MPKTNAEWRGLDEQLARQVMGWCQWHDIPQAERDSFLLIRYGGLVDAPYWDNSGQPSVGWTELTLTTQQSFWWKKHPEYRWIHAEAIREWQPHEDVAQALMAARKIVERGWGFQLRIFTYPEPLTLKSAAELWTYDTLPSEGCADTDAKAICLAIEQWLDAQKEAQEK